MERHRCIELSAPAKVNLYLDVLARREDGYHELETVFLPVPGVCDSVEVAQGEPGLGIEFECDDPELNSADNLCVRAAKEFAKFANCGGDWRIRLVKRIPVAAGLGGGSSDAAAVLRAMNHCCGDLLDAREMVELAAGLGADVPFFVAPAPAVARGVGERIEPIAARLDPALVLVNPMVPVSTRWAFGALRESDWGRGGGVVAVVGALERGDVEALAAACHNVFGRLVCEKFPICGMIRERLLDAGAVCAMVSGSGPTIFGLCESPGSAWNVEAALREFFGDSIWTGCGQGMDGR